MLEISQYSSAVRPLQLIGLFSFLLYMRALSWMLIGLLGFVKQRSHKKAFTTQTTARLSSQEAV